MIIGYYHTKVNGSNILWIDLGIKLNTQKEDQMPIICQICQRSFEKLISSTHLASHNMPTSDYKEKYGKDSLASPEYRAQRSAERSGENNPMHGRKHSDEARRKIREIKIGAIPHNKGKKVTNPDEIMRRRKAVTHREERYRLEGNHPRTGITVSDESKAKISSGVKSYAKNHPEEIKDRAQKILDSKQKTGYFNKLKQQTILQLKERWLTAGYKILTVADDYSSTLTHVHCNSVISRNLKSMFNDRACTACFPQPSVSEAERELADWLQSELGLTVVRNDTVLLGNGFELDIVAHSHKICIEYNGLYWHSEQGGKSKWYHFQKYQKCHTKGYRLIQIFEDEWIHKNSLVKARLTSIFGKNTKKIGARACAVRKIESCVAREFHNNHHLQGSGTGIQCYGLYHNDILMAVMDFNKLSRAKGAKHVDKTWELTRFSSKGNIAGGASKLMNAFRIEHDPASVISYSDLRWNTGYVYSVIGFKHIGTTLPGYWYVKGNNRYHRYKFRKDALITAGYDPTLSEDQIMKNIGYLKIWDCGHDKWEWTK